jgi:DNA-binding response OmpR family regulator
MSDVNSIPSATNPSTIQKSIPFRRIEERQELSSFTKRILIVDDDPDITLTFKSGLEAKNGTSRSLSFEVSTYNDSILALSEFKPNYYDLVLVDINMPKMNGFDFSIQILELDANPRVCFMSSGLINQDALKEQYPTLSIGCFIGKPISIEELVKRVKAELE